MKKLANKYLFKVEDYLIKNCRLLEKKLFDYHFKEANSNKVLFALNLYQNKDGGFGQGIESDIRLPDSSPMASSIGMRILDELNSSKEVKKRIKKTIKYFETTFDNKRKGWFAVPKKVNDYPHTPWWHFQKDKNMTLIDQNWGNPSVEIIAYLYKYREFVNSLDVDQLVNHAIDYINNKNEFNSENEVYCYIKLYKTLPDNYKIKIKSSLLKAVSELVELNEEKWREYVPLPLNFVTHPDDEYFNIKEDKVEANLDFYVKLIENNTIIKPPWSEEYYKGQLEIAYEEWKGVLTLKALKILDNFNRINR